jgi:hypothetical protein
MGQAGVTPDVPRAELARRIARTAGRVVATGLGFAAVLVLYLIVLTRGAIL